MTPRKTSPHSTLIAGDAAPANETPVVPDFTSGTHAFRHTVDSALASLARMHISPGRIHLRRTGRDAMPDGSIVAQYPAAGTALEADTEIRLAVAGLGFTHELPAGMRDSGGEAEPGTSEILEGVDDPLQKLAHWAHEGAELFRISAQDALACERWMALFGVWAADWPREMWFRLAALLAQLPRLSASEDGLRMALGVLFGIPIKTLHYRRSLAVAPRETTTLLGARATRLGIDTVAGDAVEDLAHLRVTLGPVQLKTYETFAAGDGRRLLLRALDFLLPAFLDYEIEWVVEDLRRCPHLGIPEDNGRLGINTHLGNVA